MTDNIVLKVCCTNVMDWVITVGFGSNTKSVALISYYGFLVEKTDKVIQ